MMMWVACIEAYLLVGFVIHFMVVRSMKGASFVPSCFGSPGSLPTPLDGYDARPLDDRAGVYLAIGATLCVIVRPVWAIADILYLVVGWPLALLIEAIDHFIWSR